MSTPGGLPGDMAASARHPPDLRPGAVWAGDQLGARTRPPRPATRDPPPPPAPAGPPTLIGGMSAAATARAAAYGDGWRPLPVPPAAVADGAARLAGLAAARGRPAPSVTASMLPALAGDPAVPGHDSLIRLLT